MAERGYLTIAFDPSFTGESGGYPRFMASPDINTEDFMAAVDFLSVREDVDPDKIGIIGICGWGGMALNAAALDTRIKVTVASTMYDMTRVNANGYFDSEDSEEARYAKKQSLNTLRTEEYHKGDIVVSQDYGVAAMALGKNAYAIHQSGKWYTNENIDQMLMERHLNKKARRAFGKNHLKGPRKRTSEDDEHFRESFEKMIHMAMDKEN